MKLEAYCFVCKEKQEFLVPEFLILESERVAIRGDCSGCGNKIFRLVKAKVHDGDLQIAGLNNKNTCVVNTKSALCPECQNPVDFAEGCMLCRSCGLSKCS